MMNFRQITTKTNGQVVRYPNEVWLRYAYDESEEWSKVSPQKKDEKQPNVDVSLPCIFPNRHAKGDC